MEIAVRNQQRTVRISPPRIERALRSALTFLANKDRGRLLRRRLGAFAGRNAPSPALEISVLLVNDRRMRELNRAYRGKDATTDVLSFPLLPGQEPPGMPEARPGALPEIQIIPLLLGDIVISLPQAERQARAYGAPLYEELSRLLVHGLLHLLGYDHEGGGSPARAMKALENELLAEIAGPDSVRKKRTAGTR